MKINEPMRQFLIDRAQTLRYELRQFPKTQCVAENWIYRALCLARLAGDVELYRQISRANDPCDAQTEKLVS